MADKIVKAFEALRGHYLQESIANAPQPASQPPAADTSESTSSGKAKKDVSLTPRERINFCNAIADYLPMQTVKNISEFPRLLTLAMELLLVCCDDNDADVRFVAGECINKIMKAFLDSNIGRIQVELYKEIKKNGASRSLRAALQRFGDTCYLIRAHKCRPYIANLLPCIVKIVKRSDDSVHEVLGTMMSKLCPILGRFMNEHDIKILLKSYLPNLKSASATTRRIAASTLNIICHCSRKPAHFYSWLINMLLASITPLTNELSSHTVLGALLCFRHIFSNLAQCCEENFTMKDSFGARAKKNETIATKDLILEKKQFHQIYEVTMFCTKYLDHNIVTAALENLNQILLSKARTMLEILLCPDGIAPTITGPASLLISSKKVDCGMSDDSMSVSSIELSQKVCEKDDTSLTDFGLLAEEDHPMETDNALFSTIPHIKVQGDNAEELDISGIEEIDVVNETELLQDNEVERQLPLSGVLDDETDESMFKESCLGINISDIPHHDSVTSFEEHANDTTASEICAIMEVEFNFDPVTCTGAPILHCVRTLCSFLLSGQPGHILPDNKARVSVKSLALNCISLALRLYPEAIYPRVIPNSIADVSDAEVSEQLIRDIILLKEHDDPQIRGAVSTIIGSFIFAGMQVSRAGFDQWNISSSEQYLTDRIHLVDYINILLDMFSDQSALVIKQNMSAVKTCINMLCHSTYDLCAYELVQSALKLSDSSYWLVKVELLEVFHILDYHLISILESLWIKEKGISNVNMKFVCLQEQFIDNVLMKLLGDEDARVRFCAATCCVKVAANLCCIPLKGSDVYSHKALHSSNMHFMIPAMEWGKHKYENKNSLSRNLSYLMRKISQQLHGTTTKYLTHGCTQCLYLLSERYPVINFPLSWGVLSSMQLYAKFARSPSLSQSHNTFVPVNNSSHDAFVKPTSSYGLQYVILDFISSTWMTLDLQAHTEALKLCVHLLCGASNYFLQKKKEKNVVNDCACDMRGGWSSIEDTEVMLYANKLFIHMMRLLSIMTYVVEQTNPLLVSQKVPTSTPLKDKEKTNNSERESPSAQSHTPPPQNFTSQNPESPRKFSITKALQKKQEAFAEESKTNPVTIPTSEGKQSSTGSLPTGGQQPEKSERVGIFQQDAHLMKLYDVLKGSFKNYQVSSVPRSHDKFCSFMRGVLESFALLMELATFNELGVHAEEILDYLKLTVCVEEEVSLLAVQQLLKGLFGTNAASQPETYELPCSTKYLVETLGDPTFYQDCNLPINSYSDIYSNYIGLYGEGFLKSYNDFCLSLKLVPQVDVSAEKGGALNFLRFLKKNVVSNRPTAKVSKERISSIQSYIRLFEPLVIHALKSYTTTSSIQLQCQAIHLLDQLIRLRVNYSLLDSEQVFIGFVLKQFEFIENGQISEPTLFITTIFQFLVLLSYECFQHKHSQAKAIVSMPRIIQLCNDVMACGLPAIMYSVPALKPIVDDLFASQSQARPDSSKDLDTQREVVVSMLLRLTRYPEILNLLTQVLLGSKSDEVKWKRLSRQVVDVVLPSLSKLDVNLISINSLLLLFNLLDSVAPLALRPADIILKPLLGAVLPVSAGEVVRFISTVIALMRTLIMQNSEDIIFSRLQQIDVSFIRGCFSMKKGEKFHLAFTKSESNAAHYFSSFLIYVLNVSIDTLLENICDLSKDKKQLFMLAEIIKLYFDLLVYIFKCGTFKKLSKSLVSLLFMEVNTENTSKTFNHHGSNGYSNSSLVKVVTDKLSALKSWEPLMFLKWVYVVRSSEISDVEFWGQFNNSWTNGRKSNIKENCSWWKEDLIRHGSLIVYCDITVSKLKEQQNIDASVIGQLLKGNIKDLMNLLTELPVKELVSRIIQQPQLTALFMESLSHFVSKDFSVVRPTMLKSILALLESTDLTYSSGVVHLLLHILPKITVYGLSRKAETLACRRLEIQYIQSLENEGNQLGSSELLQFFQQKVHSKRYPRFCALIQRITKNNIPSQLTVSHPLDTVSLDISKYKVDEQWMYTFVQELCFSEANISRRSSVHLLRSLELDHIQNIMLDKKFNIGLLEICIEEAFSSEHYLRSHIGICSSPSPFRLELVSIYDTVGCTEEENKERLLNLSKQILLAHINGILCKCKDQQMYNSNMYFSYKKDELKTLGINREQLQYYLIFIKCLIELLQQSSSYNQTWNMTMEEASSILEYVLILPLVCAHELDHLKANIMVLELCFHSFSLILHCEEFRLCLSKEQYAYMLVSSISSIHKIVQQLTLEKGEYTETHSQPIFNPSAMDNSQNTITPDETKAQQTTNVFQKACLQISWLIHSLRDTVSCRNFTRCCLPSILVQPLRQVITGLARLPIVNSFARIPPIVWKFGWQAVVEGEFLTEFPPLPVDILKEKDVLEEFIFRVNQIGWISRMQFEETWAALLGVLSSIPIVEEISNEEEIEVAQSSSLVVHCITSLLLDTMLSPSPGNAAVSQYSVIHRQKDYPFLGSKPGKKLVAVRNKIELHFCDFILSNERKKHKMLVYPVVPSLLSPKQRKLFLHYGCMMKRRLYISNLELPPDLTIFNLGQVSAAAIRTRLITSDTQEDTDSDDSDSLIIALKERSSTSSFGTLPSDLFRKLEELDIRSCLQFLLELFEQWLSPAANPRTPLMLKMEAIKSLCVLSDFFLELNHYEWILGILLEFSQTHPVEDEITTQYLVPTMCKALSILKLQGNTAERVCKQVEINLKSPHIPLQVSCMVGSLYILETSVNTTLLILVPILTEYVMKKLNSQQDATTIVSQRFKMVFWSLTFYLMENCSSENPDSQFPVLVLETTLNELKKSSGGCSPTFLHILFQGLERLAVSFSLTRQECDEVAKVAANWVYLGSTQMVLSALGLLCTCIYTGKDSDHASGLLSADLVNDSPMTESRLVVMEIINILLSRIRKGRLSEAVLLATILPRILLDFLPVHEVMNKLIAEFLSSQQPRPELIAKIFNKVSDLLYRESEVSLVCEWVFLSVASFVQRTPLCMAVWSLTCFFISASTNPWLKSIFPFTVERKGKLESKDKEIFCIAALDFYLNQNLNVSQREQFLQTFRSKCEMLPSSPYESLINCCMHAVP